MKHAALSRTSGIHMRFATSADFVGLRNLRQQVFCNELDIQETDYYDVISDWHSKNVVIMDGCDLIGAVRLAFIPAWREFYVSYLCIRSSHRNLALLRSIFGSLILLMRQNSITSVRADSADNNMSMYLSMGCVPVGEKFYKTGFRCAWTPLRYTIGVNAKAEDVLAARTQALFDHDQSNDLLWRFPTTIYNCPSLHTFRSTFLHQLEQGLIPGHLPHLSTVGSSDVEHSLHLELHEVALDEQSPAHLYRRDDIDEALNRAFWSINCRISRRHVVLALAQSSAIDMIKLYCVSSRKHLIELQSWDDAIHSDLNESSSAIAIFGPADVAPRPSELRCHCRCTFGLMSSDTLSGLSRKLLNSYLSSIGPMTVSMQVGPIAAGACGSKHREWHPFMSKNGNFSENTVDKNLITVGRHHRVVVPAGVARAATRSLGHCLASGQTIGASVLRTSIDLSLSDDEALLLYGDPCVGFQVLGDVGTLAATDLGNLCARF